MTNEKAMSWIYTANRTATNVNAAGHPIIIDITLASGQVGRIIAMRCQSITAGTHTGQIDLIDEDSAEIARIASIPTAANIIWRLPSIGSAATAGANCANSTGMIIPSGGGLSIYTATDSGQANDTLQVAICIELFNKSTTPTWSYSRSTDAANITLAASTISAANTLVAGRVW